MRGSFGSTAAADALLAAAADGDRRRLLALDRHVVGDGEDDVVAVAQLQLESLALHRRAIADAVDLQVLLETPRNAGDHIADQVARGAPGHPRLLRIVHGLEDDLVALDLRLDLVADVELQLAQLALGRELSSAELDGDAGRDGDRRLAYAGHRSALNRRDTGPRRRHWRRGPRYRT